MLRWKNRVKEMADHFCQRPVTVGKATMNVEDLLQRDSLSQKGTKTHGGNVIKKPERNSCIFAA
jgi:hypothetical protein